LSLHHGQHDPEHVEKDLIQDKVVDVSLRPVDVAGLGEPVAILCGRWGSHHMDARNENDRFLVQGYTAARDRSFQFEIGAARQPGRSAGFSASAQPSSADGP
jgi:acyl-homoserine lactone acylase PvdQ